MFYRNYGPRIEIMEENSLVCSIEQKKTSIQSKRKSFLPADITVSQYQDDTDTNHDLMLQSILTEENYRQPPQQLHVENDDGNYPQHQGGYDDMGYQQLGGGYDDDGYYHQQQPQEGGGEGGGYDYDQN